MRKLWAAGAAIVMCLALGGVPVVAQGDATAVTGTGTCEVVSAGTTTTLDGMERVTDTLNACTDTASDPRVSGPTTNHFNYQQQGDHFVYWGWTKIEGPDGTWEGSYYGRSDVENPGAVALISGVNQGTGDYAGWTYLLDVVLSPGGYTYEGLIYKGPPPPTWEATAASDEAGT